MNLSPKTSAFFGMLGLSVFLLFTAGCSINDSYSVTSMTENSVHTDKDKSIRTLEQVNQLSEQLYSAANEENRQLAYSLIGRLETVAGDSVIRRSGMVQGWTAFDKSLEDAKLAIVQTGTSSSWYRQAARLKLASDALLRPEAPLWLQYEQVLSDDENRLQQAWQSQQEGHAEAAVVFLHIFREHIERFEVAALMQREASLLTNLKDRLDYTERLLHFTGEEGNIDPASIPQSFQALSLAISDLFASSSVTSSITVQSAPGVMTASEYRAGREQLVIMYISAIVLGILAFAGWRRFTYEQKHGVPYRKAEIINKKRD